jgi:fatty-acyl-CoA synthase
LVTNGGAALSPTVRDALKAALPHAALMDAVGASESGSQMSVVISADHNDEVSVFTPQPDTAVLAEDLSSVLTGGAGGEGWLARRDYIPLGYLGDRAKTEKTFPTVDGVRWSVPGDRARALPDGRIELLGRDSATINSGGEKIFAEEVERAVACHPAVYDVVVVGRPSQRWGSEVVAVVQLVDGAEPTDADLREVCAQHLVGYKIPKSFVRTTKVVRSPAGKADYRWAKQVAARDTHTHHDDRDTAAAL